ncbi:uncharacterized protein BO95DRAFT_443016 [Aspergillus brunneoviolaceus CBS 621.78]|uniref:Uncharacterized protein n=1 Tax=Aspergillus brunneoviolaceus CBS 621.78 TaxID=1450534 RepID=A0ACD1G8J6_9EURO|nr:hypothetical protein BO95DRAFT_443016 [Aspergillus brunneoviolaceus CBS 621.78]RAH45614.1 hypothetical protein BO95DRAFT_443016 [Aspergillus brunneoviolaceus CBS 621.78]
MNLTYFPPVDASTCPLPTYPSLARGRYYPENHPYMTCQLAQTAGNHEPTSSNYPESPTSRPPTVGLSRSEGEAPSKKVNYRNKLRKPCNNTADRIPYQANPSRSLLSIPSFC